MKRRIGAITIILIVLSVFIAIYFSLLSLEVSDLNVSCALLEDDVLGAEGGILSAEFLSKTDTWLSCILQKRDTEMSLTITLYMLVLSILLTLVSWKTDKLKKKH